METHLADFIRDTPHGRTAEDILRKCVHCGFCTATCPTYQLLGDERDGPRGRIYLIKQVLEGQKPSERTRRHLDRCLTCLNCETTCPSGVKYGRLVDIGREVVEHQAPRPAHERLIRRGLRSVLPYRGRFGALLGLGRSVRALLPRRLAAMVEPAPAAGNWPVPRHSRRMLVLPGCVQPALAPRINAAAARVLDHMGISLVSSDASGCCGAIDHHLSASEAALHKIRANVDLWSAALDEGFEAIVMTASGCGSLVKQYGELLAHDPAYAERAARVSRQTLDLAEVIGREGDGGLPRLAHPRRVAFHPPCTLQHGQAVRGVVEGILQRVGFELAPVSDSHLCCGSAGTYSLLQPQLSEQLRERKLGALTANRPEVIASANIGCLHHLQSAAKLRICHWIELVDEAHGED